MVFTVHDRRELIAAELMAQNACLTEYGIRYRKSGQKAQTCELLERIGRQVLELGSYAQSQEEASAARCTWTPLGGSVLEEKQVKYLNTTAQTGILRCYAAEIGARLRRELGERKDIRSVLKVYQKWINRNFTYKRTGDNSDFTAVSLLLRGCGVCQAIASLGTLVLPWLGVETRYVSGSSLPTGVGHAWNQLRTEKGRWIHADFTFGLNQFQTPTTLTALSEAAFRREHRWEREPSACSLELDSENIFRQVLEEGVDMAVNAHGFKLGRMLVETKRPVLKDCRVDLALLLPLFGGCCEYVRRQDQLRVHLFQRSCILERAGQYLSGGDGYVSAAALGRLPLGARVSDRGLRLDLTCWEPRT